MERSCANQQPNGANRWSWKGPLLSFSYLGLILPWAWEGVCFLWNWPISFLALHGFMFLSSYPSNLFHRSSGVSSPHPIWSLSQTRYLPSVVAILAPTAHVPSREFCLYWFFLHLVICEEQTSDSLGRWKSQSFLPRMGAGRGRWWWWWGLMLIPLAGIHLSPGVSEAEDANTNYEIKELSSWSTPSTTLEIISIK